MLRSRQSAAKIAPTFLKAVIPRHLTGVIRRVSRLSYRCTSDPRCSGRFIDPPDARFRTWQARLTLRKD